MLEQAQFWVDTNKKVAENMRKVADASNNLGLSLLRQNMEVANICLSSGLKQVQDVSSAKRFQDVVTAQSQNLQSLNQDILSNVHSTVEILDNSKKEFTTLTENTLQSLNGFNPWIKAE